MKHLKGFNEKQYSHNYEFSEDDIENVKRLWEDGYHDVGAIAKELDYTDIDEESVEEIIEILKHNNQIEDY
jgi:hypothetical protein